MNKNIKSILFEKYFESEKIGVLIISDWKMLYMNDSFKELSKLFGLNVDKISPLDIYRNYNKYLMENSELIELKGLIDHIKIFNHSNTGTNAFFKDIMEFNGRYLEFNFEGLIIEDKKYYFITVLDMTNEIKLLDYKYLSISKKISELSFKELSKANFDSRKIYIKIFNLLKDFNIVAEMVVATLKNDNQIHIEFGIIDKINLSGKIYDRKSKSLTAYVIDKNKKIYIPNSLDYVLPDGYKIHHVGDAKPYSVFGVPLRDENNKAYGAILYERPNIHNFSKLELTLLDEVTYAIQSVIRFSKLYGELHREKERYYEMSIKDHLTKAYNRTFMEEYLKKSYEKIKRYDEDIVLSFIDIDNFKMINDKFGHDYGDMCLTIFSEAVFENIRESDIFTRYGGDEFVIIFPNTTMKKASNVMRRIRKVLNKLEEPIEISYGIMKINKNITLKDNINRVDKLMYEMKRIKNTGTK
ncbi:diguanylate cyclase (GGDEF) domain-containing protein [Marinitoga hydrogenitolerans DSM 16785]|uniref:Diguanylate cyclase (GGDEF) domain-containing protein n=1 Tax=Marinitoga hydrogenitolerans (strain DSM 16785 / JCM 12826 / AT1271) TaxID=1122195 RepID=A0A1M4T0C4_MARH1|nr:diguanylate cyclase [Marinitoga hydrogenitolerans]SHE37932.1 diguanylate cyclase (GGDEF) domain-containing protein [Marinitoga hydrogenitolerans DSM 16785]